MKLKCFNIIKMKFIYFFIIIIIIIIIVIIIIIITIIIIKIGFSWEFSLKIQHCCK